jgi:hypothetical protein
MPLILNILFFLIPLNNICNPSEISDPVTDIHQLWKDCKLEGIVSSEIFSMAMVGYNQIDKLKVKKIITIIDYTKASTEKRFFVIDLGRKLLLYNCLVAHGKNSGENYAGNFSNQSGSSESCLGFFITAETYNGKNGYSLCLDGIETGINDNARKRSIVIHGADYVSQEFIKKYNRLGRSWGCPALPADLSKEIIDCIASGSCIFIYGNDKEYLKNSKLIRNRKK